MDGNMGGLGANSGHQQALAIFSKNLDAGVPEQSPLNGRSDNSGQENLNE